MGVGFLVGGRPGMVVALGFAVATNLFAYWRSGDMVLRLYGARESIRARRRTSTT